MDIFLKNINDRTTSTHLEKYLRKEMRPFGIRALHCQKLKGKSCAIVTVLDVKQGEAFLKAHAGKQSRLFLFQKLYCDRGKQTPDKNLLRALEKDMKDVKVKEEKSNGVKIKLRAPILQADRQVLFAHLSVGVWNYPEGGQLQYVPHYQDHRTGRAMFGHNTLALILNAATSRPGDSAMRVDIRYSTINSITIGNVNQPYIVLTLSEAPRLYRLPGVDHLTQQFLGLGLGRNFKVVTPKRERVSSINNHYTALMGECMVYRIVLSNGAQMHLVKSILDGPEMPAYIAWPLLWATENISFADQKRWLTACLDGPYSHLSFGIKFQLERLVSNGYLLPYTVAGLLLSVNEIAQRSGSEVTVHALREFAKCIDFGGPQSQPDHFSVHALVRLLEEKEQDCKGKEHTEFSLAKRHKHMVLVHRVNVTPTAIFLAGPFAEVKNRVLRKYEEHVPTSFLRVSFTEEDGNPIWGEPNVSLTTIFHQRYQSVLDHAIRIGGKSFEFLGFSHSSLRERTCWFMAPITYQGRQLQADRVINDLGDFSAIRTPAKCAARIGQAFTETPETLRIPATCVKQIPDIERNNRVFSDGVGTISGSIVAQLWRLPSAREHPTLFQIRFRGAKGMIALDSRLEGEQLCIRPSMTKFGTRDHTDLEICGSGARTLQFYLNRQLIKILEDLGVPIGSFTTLQEIAVNELRMATTTPVNAASFLERHNIGKGTSLPWLIRKLHYIDVSFFEDPFLRSCIELAILTQLREIKYRARILVHDGVTLYGIMDETDTLKEGEIYCRTDRAVVEGIVYVSRSPAMHPGDIQKVKAVDVPEGSPLEALHNCIVFSQRGARDLPSMLSGGDLDGDMFHVIFDPNLYPNLTVSPADYPRVSPEDIGRAVNRHDMTEFFVDFMENDQLGRISNLHMQLADQKPGGTMDEDCIKLAEMASTAVDFSKTGIKVDMMQAPRSNTYRPDFMAPGPFIKLDQTTPRIAYQEEALEEDEEDIVAAQDPDKRTTKYYESDKALGVLYRRIDEAAFYDEINKHASGFTKKRGIVAQKIWDYVQGQVQLVFWGHHVPLAREIKEEYYFHLVDMMFQFSPHYNRPLREIEVFTGTILGKDGSLPSKTQRDEKKQMKTEFEEHVEYTVKHILHGTDDGNHSETEALARSVACLSVAMEESEAVPKIGKLESFRYIAATICLQEVQKFHNLPF